MGIVVAVIDPDPLVGEGLRALLNADPEITTIRSTARASHIPSLVTSAGCAAVVVHHQPPALDCMDVVGRVVNANAQTVPVLVITETLAEPGLDTAVRAGARGYLSRSTAVPLLGLAVHVAIAGGLVVDAAAVNGDCLTGWPAPGIDVDTARLLSAREQVVFRLLAEGRNNAEIAAELSVAASTVKKHVSAVLRKLKLRDRQHVAVVGNRARMRAAPTWAAQPPAEPPPPTASVLSPTTPARTRPVKTLAPTVASSSSALTAPSRATPTAASPADRCQDGRNDSHLSRPLARTVHGS